MSYKKDSLPLAFSLPLLGAIFLHLVCESMVIPILVPMLAEVEKPSLDMLPGASNHLRDFLYGLTLAAYPIAVFLFAPLLGLVSDAKGRKGLLIVTIFLSFLACAIQALSVVFLSLWVFIFARIFIGALAGVDGIIQASLVSHSKTEAQKNFYLGASLFVMTLGFMVGPAFASIFMGLGDSAKVWSLPFWINAILFFICVGFLYFSLPKDKSSEAKKISLSDWKKSLGDILLLGKFRNARQRLIIFVTSQVASAAFSGLLPLMLVRNYDFSAQQLAYFISIFSLGAGVIFLWLGPLLISKFSMCGVLRFSVWMSLITLLVPLFGNEYFVWGMVVVASFGFPLTYYSVLAMFSKASSDKRRGWVLSVISAIWGLTTGLGLLICAAAISILSLEQSMIFCVVLAFACLFFSCAKLSEFTIDFD